MAARPARRFFQTPPTMAYPQGRVAVRVPALASVFVIDHTGKWEMVPGRTKPDPGWPPLTSKDARERLSADGFEDAHGNTPT